jgi:hypothetical protein
LTHQKIICKEENLGYPPTDFYLYISYDAGFNPIDYTGETEYYRTEKNRAQQSREEQSRTEQNRTEQNMHRIE